MEHLREEIPELEGMMTELVTADRITRSKPDPEGYILAANLLGADPKNCVVFEDSLQGVKAGRASGAYVTGIAGTLPASVIEYPPVQVFPHGGVPFFCCRCLSPVPLEYPWL